MFGKIFKSKWKIIFKVKCNLVKTYVISRREIEEIVVVIVEQHEKTKKLRAYYKDFSGLKNYCDVDLLPDNILGQIKKYREEELSN